MGEADGLLMSGARGSPRASPRPSPRMPPTAFVPSNESTPFIPQVEMGREFSFQGERGLWEEVDLEDHPPVGSSKR